MYRMEVGWLDFEVDLSKDSSNESTRQDLSAHAVIDLQG